MSTSSGALFRHQLNKIQKETNRDHRLLVATHRGKHISERNPENGPILIVIEIIMNDSIIILLIKPSFIIASNLLIDACGSYSDVL